MTSTVLSVINLAFISLAVAALVVSIAETNRAIALIAAIKSKKSCEKHDFIVIPIEDSVAKMLCDMGLPFVRDSGDCSAILLCKDCGYLMVRVFGMSEQF